MKHPRSATQNFETPMNRGNHWDISDGDIGMSINMQPPLQDTIMETGDLEIGRASCRERVFALV